MLNTIGEIAGYVWHYLDENGSSSVAKIANETGLNKGDVQRGIGWLIKEDKLSIVMIGRTETISLK
jgi:hypothetical protein